MYFLKKIFESLFEEEHGELYLLGWALYLTSTVRLFRGGGRGRGDRRGNGGGGVRGEEQ